MPVIEPGCSLITFIVSTKTFTTWFYQFIISFKGEFEPEFHPVAFTDFFKKIYGEKIFTSVVWRV